MKQARITFLPIVAALSIGLVCAGTFAQSGLRHFNTGSYQSILEQQLDRPFMLVLWSLECSPCHEELAMLGRMKRKYPMFNLVLIATDGINARDEIILTLQRHRLENVSIWVFDQERQPMLRYRIDPTWYGELPRSYLFDAKHKRQAISGRVKEQHLRAWLSRTHIKPQ